MKDFKQFRENLDQDPNTIEEGLGVALPPNILILRRQSIRHFPGQTLVALYYNDKLDQYFSIPFGGEDNLITPAYMKEEQQVNEGLTGPTRMQLQNHFDTAHGTDREKLNSTEKAHGISDIRLNSKKQIISWKSESQSRWDKKHGDISKHLEEAEQLDELSRDTLKSYVEKTRRVAADHHKRKTLIPWNKMLKHNRGTSTAIKKLFPKNTIEEAEQLDEINLGKGDHEVIKSFLNKKPHKGSKKLSTDGKKLHGNWMGGSGIAHHSDHGLHLNDLGSKSADQVHRAIKKHNTYGSGSDVPHHNIIHESKNLQEDAITHLRSVKEFHTGKELKHKDGTQTKVDPTTAHALLTVHDALSDEHKTKFKDQLEKSKGHFHRMVDFAWKNVK